MRKVQAGFLLLALTVATGCPGRPTPPAPVSVSGKLFDAQKKPVGGVIVRFWPQPDHAGSHDGVAQNDGSFDLKCPPGKYDVTLMAIPSQQGAEPAAGGTVNPDKSKAPKTNIPERFLDVRKTPLRNIEVPADGRGGIELTLAE
jgi:hypothetical protein